MIIISPPGNHTPKKRSNPSTSQPLHTARLSQQAPSREGNSPNHMFTLCLYDIRPKKNVGKVSPDEENLKKTVGKVSLGDESMKKIPVGFVSKRKGKQKN